MNITASWITRSWKTFLNIENCVHWRMAELSSSLTHRGCTACAMMSSCQLTNGCTPTGTHRVHLLGRDAPGLHRGLSALSAHWTFQDQPWLCTRTASSLQSQVEVWLTNKPVCYCESTERWSSVKPPNRLNKNLSVRSCLLAFSIQSTSSCLNNNINRFHSSCTRP